MNIKDYLDDRNIRYWNTGKNISDGWIGLQCRWCGDPSNHLGIHLQTNAVSCFRCGKHSLVKLIMSIDRIGFEEAKAIITKYGGGRLFAFRGQEIPKDRPAKVILPGEKDLMPVHKKYLESRNFDPVKMHKKYQFTCVGPIGNYKLRMCVPFYIGKQIITFQSRDITGLSNLPYKSQPDDEAIIPVKHTIYKDGKPVAVETIKVARREEEETKRESSKGRKIRVKSSANPRSEGATF